MGDQSRIEWTDATWNPTRGCSKVSEGCRNCYAMRQAIRQSGPGRAYEGLVRSVPGKGPQWTGEVRLAENALQLPLSWHESRRVFVDSMSDLFHEQIEEAWIDRVFAIMALCPHHTFQILTKRPERAAWYLGERDRWYRNLLPKWAHPVQRVIESMIATQVTPEDAGLWSWPLPNVWIGTSVEDQAAANERIPHLLRAPAAVRFLSCEPLLGPVDLIGAFEVAYPGGGVRSIMSGYARMPRIDWVIAGGESGPGARRFDVGWARLLRDQCHASNIPFFLKQMGRYPFDANDQGFDGDVTEEPSAWPTGTELGAHYEPQYQGELAPLVLISDRRKGGDPGAWPSDLRIRDFPNTTR